MPTVQAKISGPIAEHFRDWAYLEYETPRLVYWPLQCPQIRDDAVRPYFEAKTVLCANVALEVVRVNNQYEWAVYLHPNEYTPMTSIKKVKWGWARHMSLESFWELHEFFNSVIKKLEAEIRAEATTH